MQSQQDVLHHSPSLSPLLHTETQTENLQVSRHKNL